MDLLFFAKHLFAAVFGSGAPIPMHRGAGKFPKQTLGRPLYSCRNRDGRYPDDDQRHSGGARPQSCRRAATCSKKVPDLLEFSGSARP